MTYNIYVGVNSVASRDTEEEARAEAQYVANKLGHAVWYSEAGQRSTTTVEPE